MFVFIYFTVFSPALGWPYAFNMPLYEFYRVQLDEGHIRTFVFAVRVTLPSQAPGSWMTGELAMNPMGYKYEGGYRVCVPRIGARDAIFYEGSAPIPGDGNDVAVGFYLGHTTRGVKPRPDERWRTLRGATWPWCQFLVRTRGGSLLTNIK